MKLSLKIVCGEFISLQIKTYPIRKDNQYSIDANILYRIFRNKHRITNFLTHFTNHYRIKRQGGTWLPLN